MYISTHGNSGKYDIVCSIDTSHEIILESHVCTYMYMYIISPHVSEGINVHIYTYVRMYMYMYTGGKA